MPRVWSLLGLLISSFALLIAGCDEQCRSLQDCPVNQLCYSGNCQSPISKVLACTSNVTIVDPNTGEVAFQGCAPEGTADDENLKVACVNGRCQFKEEDPVIWSPYPDATVADTGTATPDTGMMMGTPDSGILPDADFVTPSTACTFPANLPTNPDTSAPRVGGFITINGTNTTETVQSGDALAIEIPITEQCGLVEARVTLSVDAAGGSTDAREDIVLDGTIDNMAGTITVMGAVSSCLQSAVYTVSEVYMKDYAGNTSLYAPGATSPTIYDISENGGAPTSAGVLVASVTVQATTASPPPPLATVVATDNGSGMDVAVTIANQNANCHLMQIEVVATSSLGHSVTAVAAAQAIGMPPAGGSLSANVTVPACALAGDWTVDSIKVVDSSSRVVNYTSTGGGNYIRSSDGQDTGIIGAAATLTGSGTDQGGPTIDDIQMMKNLDPMGTLVNFNVAASDDVCFLGSGNVTLSDGTRSFTGSLERNQNNLVTGCLAMPLCAAPGTYTLSPVWVADQAGASVTATTSIGLQHP